MQPKIHHSSSRSGASIAAPEAETESKQMVLELRAISASAGTEPPSARLRVVREMLADLVLEDDLDQGNGLLLSSVAVDLNEILLELDRLSGLQRMFEAVMAT